MNDQHIIFSPERNQWTLADGRHHMEVPEWAREIMRDEFERETRPLRDSLDLSLDSKRIAERRVTELLAENDRLREFASKSFSMAFNFYHGAGTAEDLRELKVEYHELGIEMEP